MKKVVLGKNKIAFNHVGRSNKPKLLMLHGLFTNSKYFEETIAFLKKDFNVLAPEFPGFGYSDRLRDRSHTLEHYADIIIELCDYLSFKPFHLVGASLGGMVSMVLVHKYPDYVQKLILQASPWNKNCINYSFYEKIVSTASKNKQLVKAAKALKKGISRKILLQVMNIFNKHYSKIEKRNGVIYHSFRTMDLEATSEVWNNLKNADLSSIARSIKKPTLVISGDHDEQVYPLRTKLLSRLIKNSKFIMLRGNECTHALFLDDPEGMATIIKDFLNNQDIKAV
jgi:pimeloyl-ACP methyl ester carboxylesterase